jgi:hypothetical protein
MSLMRFAGALTALVPDCTASDIADTLWLATQIPESGVAGGNAPPMAADPRPWRSSGGTAVSALDFACALQPLNRRSASPTGFLLDENATADRIAREGRRLPVLTAVSEKWLDLALVVDDGPSMSIWQDTAAGFRTMLENVGAFRDVRVWRLNTDAHSGDPLLLRSGAPAGQAMVRSPWELHDPSHRRVILVFSDGISRAWRDRRMSGLLEQWGTAGHVSIVQPLPQRLWSRCAPVLAAVKIHAPRPVMENARFASRYRHVADPGDGYRHRYGEEPCADDGIPIPVFSVEPRWLARWAQLVTGNAHGANMPVMFTRRAAQPARNPARATAALDRVTRFRATASQEAFQLAGYLAFAPMTPRVMRLVQETMMPAARTSHLAEVLLGGLLVRRAAAAETAGTEDGPVSYDFHQGVRETLRSTVPRSAGLRVLRQVSRHIADQPNSPVNPVALLESPSREDLIALSEADRPFAEVARSALRALGGRYARIAEQLGRILEPLPAPASTATSRRAGMSGPSGEYLSTASAYRPLPRSEFLPAETEPLRNIARPSSQGGDVSHPPSAGQGRARRGELPAIWIGVPPRNPNFSGREELLRSIRERLTSKVTALVPHALHGYGGVGKTHLAIEYVYRYQSAYDLVCWISAEQPAMVRTAIADLAIRMNLQFLTIDDAVRSVLAALRQGYPFERWLLIFDNANQPEDFGDFFPSGSGHILLTSRNDVWAGSAQVVEVDVFPRRESIDFLRSRLSGAISEDEADQLADRLDDLPLALEQAAAWQAETGTPVGDYLRAFDERIAHLQEVAAVREQVRPTDYPLTVAVAWSLAIDRLREEQPEVVQLLQLCAFFAPEPIPWNLLSVGRFVLKLPEDLRRAISSNRDRDRMIREIKKYALAQVDYGSSRLQLHRLAQIVLREQLGTDTDRAEVRHQAHMVLAAADPGDPDIPDNWDRYRALWPHVQPSGSMECTEKEVRELVLNLTRYLYVTGSYDAGLAVAESTLLAWTGRFADADQGSLILVRHLATILRALGHIGQAGERSMQSYEKLRAVYGEDDEETLSAGNLVGGTYRDLGRFKDALDLDQDLHMRHRRIFGDEHPRTLMSANNHALDHFLMGDYKKAIALDARVLQVRREVLGDTNPFTLCSEYSYARDLRESGQYWQARIQLEETLGRYTATLGEIHPDTLRAAKHLAVARRKAGDYENARELSERTFTAYQSRLGAVHPDSLSAAQNLVNDLRLTRDFDAAARLGSETLEEYRRVLGENHPFTLSAENNYAIVLRQSGRLEDGREISLHAFKGLERALGHEHPYTLSAATTHANDLHATGDYTLALELLDKTYGSFKKVLGKLHPYTLACGVNLIEELHITGQNENAELLQDAVKERYAEVLGEDHPEVIAGRTQGVRGECSTDAPHT